LNFLAEVVALGEEAGNAARVVGFFIGGEQEGCIALCLLGGRDQTGRRALDVAGAQADRTVGRHAQCVRVGAPVRRVGHGVHVHVEHTLRSTAHGQQGNRAGAEVGELETEARQRPLKVVEHRAPDLTRWIAGVEGHQLFEVRKNGFEQCHGESP
jgi:hypothetical protein